MIRKIFLTEWKGYALACGAGLIVCLLAAAGISLAGAGAADAARADHAEYAFQFLNAVSYAMPAVLLLMAIFSFRRYYRLAGVTEEKIMQGALFNLFTWTTIFLAALMLFATFFDLIIFAGADAVRGQTSPQCMLLSLREHGAYRLLFAPSVAVTVSILYMIYDFVRVAVRRPKFLVFKVLIAVVCVLVLALYQYTVYCMAMVPGVLADAAWLVPPDSVLPVVPAWAGSWQDAVKDVHFLASPVLNLFFIAGELIFIVLYYGFVRVIGRCKNEIEES